MTVFVVLIQGAATAAIAAASVAVIRSTFRKDSK